MKRLLLIGAFVVSACCTFSQTIIPKAGVTLPKFGGDDGDGSESNLGFTVGLGFNLPIGTSPLSVQPELNFIQKGSKDSENGATAKLKMNYLELPILLKATFGENTKFYVNAGPSLGFGLGGKTKATVGSFSGEADIKFGKGNDQGVLYIKERTDFGLQFGAGVIIVQKVMIDVRYGLGISKVTLTSDGGSASVKNNVLQFTIGFPIALK